MELLKEVTTFFVVVANLGYYSIVGKAINPLVKIIAFEHMPGPQKYFKKNLALNSFNDIVLEPLAPSNNEGANGIHISYKQKICSCQRPVGRRW